MKLVIVLLIHLLVTIAKLLRPGGTRAVVAETLLLKHQLMVLNRSRQRASNLERYHWQGHCGGLFQLPIAA